jgi:hypothetical protein
LAYENASPRGGLHPHYKLISFQVVRSVSPKWQPLPPGRVIFAASGPARYRLMIEDLSGSAVEGGLMNVAWVGAIALFVLAEKAVAASP